MVRLTEAVGSKWEDAPIPTEIDQKPFTSGLASGKVSVHASLTGSGEIHGRLIPDSAVEGTWQLTLERLGNSCCGKLPCSGGSVECFSRYVCGNGATD